jgi:glycosyltransferase involved in cell wall biosynthesis
VSGTAAAPRLTLGLPVYNGKRFLAQSLDALLAQTYSDFELIISDNGSTDRTPEIGKHYQSVDPRVRYIRHDQNRGSTFNHNFVLGQARGELFKWVSDDDLYAPDLLQRCVDALDTRPELALAHSWTAFIDEDSKITERSHYGLTTDVSDPVERFRSVLYTDGGDDMYGVIRMSVLRQMAPFNSYHWADRTFVAELALHGPFHNESDFLYFRRDHPMRTSRVGRNNIRLRCSRLDPARANRWRHPLVRLTGEYVLGFASAIRRTPLSARDRRRCMKELAVWLASHANPRHQRQSLENPEPALLMEGGASLPTGTSAAVSAHQELVRSLEHRERSAQ